MKQERIFRSIWLWSFGFFLLAAGTGVMYRLGLTGSLPFELSLGNIRHAHSHLMFFNWVTPVPMLFIAAYIARSAEEITSFRRSIYTILGLGLASFPFFLFYGYQPVPIGSVELPLSVIFSGLVMIGWYWFVRIYISCRKNSVSGYPRMFYDAALLMLVVSSLGAWGVAVLQFGGVENMLLSTACTHFFLAVFTGGWCVLSALGIIFQVLEIRELPFHNYWLIAPIVLGVPLTFPFGIPAGLLTGQLLVTASFGAFIMMIGLGANLYVVGKTVSVRGSWWWIVVLNLLATKMILLFGGALFPFIAWMGEHGLRLLYLHVVLLGFVTITYLSAWHTLNPLAGKGGFKLMTLAILLMLAILLLSSGIVPSGLVPSWYVHVLLYVSILIVLAGLREWAVYRMDRTGRAFI